MAFDLLIVRKTYMLDLLIVIVLLLSVDELLAYMFNLLSYMLVVEVKELED